VLPERWRKNALCFAYPLASPLATGNALLHRGGHGTGQLQRVITPEVIAGSRRRVEAHLQAAEVAQLTDDAPTDLLDPGRYIGIGGWLAPHKARLEVGLGAIQTDALQEDTVEMEVQIDRTAKTLDKGHQPRWTEGQNPRRLQLKASSSSWWQVSQPSRRKP